MNRYIHIPIQSIKKYWFQTLFVFIILFFIFEALFFASQIKFGTSPDETHHYLLGQEYSKTTLIPNNSEDTYRFGPVNDQPYLYYIFIGKIIHLNIFPVEDYTFFRTINIGLSLLTILVSFKIFSFFTENKLAKLSFLVVMTNTLMFTFLSAAINYDNLVNLFSAVAIYFTLVFLKKKNLNDLFYFVLFSCLALLTKFTFLPLGLILGLVILIDSIKTNLKQTTSSLFDQIKKAKSHTIILAFFTLFSLILAFELYGLNFIKYRNYAPSCTQILTHEQCLNNAIYKRRITLDETTQSPENPINPGEYFYHWTNFMQQRTYGILAHQNMPKPSSQLFLYNILFLAAGVMLIRYFSPKEKNAKLLTYSAIIAAFYVLVLAFYQNYQSYLARGRMDIALQGRYLFPVLSTIYLLFIYPLFTYSRNNYLQVFIFIVICIIFIYGDLFFFLENVTSAWYN